MAKQKSANDGPRSDGPRSDGPLSFEQSLGKLEEIVGKLEDGELGLEDSLAQYEQGVKCLRQCFELLERAQRKIELLSGVDEDGQPITESFAEDEGQSLEEKAATRGRRRSKKASGTAQKEEKNDIDETSRLF